MSENEGIRSVQDGGVLMLVMDRPTRKNALTGAMYSDLAEALEQANGQPEVRAVLVTGAGEAFTAGNDLADFLAEPPKDTEAPVFRFLLALARFSKPLVAAVDGVAVGIGTTMLLHCDLVFASTRAKLSMPFCKLGLTPEGASSLLLPALVGPQRAAELLYYGDPIGAERAGVLGLVNQVVTPERLLEVALERCAELCRRPPAALRAAKKLLRGHHQAEIEATLLGEAKVFIERLSSPEAREAISAFMEKRQPDWSSFS